ncbi:MAG TPA: prolyl oligopeptidase family serine peptidase, partial [Candidatus Dormibacteraeota bacterium]|nr:prolyl oligopeptidase family serine peptidase [Candidatus Dormibacteraeota bacterium]
MSSPIWSPGGEEIAFIAPNGLDAGLLERLWVVPLTGAGPRCLTAGFDRAVNDTVINDMRAGHGARICWSASGDRVYFLASGPGVTALHSVDLDGNVSEIAGGRRRLYDFDVAAGVIAFSASDASNPGELYIQTQGAEARLTDLNPWLRDRYIAQPEHHQFTAPDGWQLEGWVLKPEAFDPNRLHPMVMEIHGGPHGQYGWAFFHELQILAGMGYVVFYANPRGSDGYGERFRREVVRDWGGKDFVDLMSSLDQLIERTGYIDTDRMGVGGGSYGGYMTNWILGQTDRFSAAVSMRSISNLVSEYSQHDIVLWGALELGPPPYPDLDELWRRSPIRYVQNYRTPLLLTCGEMDLRCAISQSEELFGALRLLGKTVELVRFPEESHDLSRNGRPDRRVERLRRIAGWYERFLGTAAVDRGSEAATQVLPVPAEANREWAKTVAIPSAVRPVEVVEPEPAPEPAAAGAVAVETEVAPEAKAEAEAEAEAGAPEPPAMEEILSGMELVAVDEPEPAPLPAAALGAASDEPQVIQPVVVDEPAAQPELAEPEALPVLPEPLVGEAEAEPLAETEPVAEAEPEPVAAAVEEEPEPIAAAVEPASEPQAEVATAELAVEEPPSAAPEPWAEPSAVEVEPRSEPRESEAEATPEPVVEPVASARETQPSEEPAVAVDSVAPEPVALEPAASQPAANEPAAVETWGSHAPPPQFEPESQREPQREPEPEPQPQPAPAATTAP